MGISLSNNRRRNNPYYPHRPPPPPYYYPADPVALPHPPPPPPPPPPPHQSYFPASSTPSYPAPQNPYPAHPPPPIQPYNYSSNPYNSCNYANRFSYQPYYYANQASGWPAVRANLGPVEPAPYIEHQNAKKVSNDVNVHKDTLRVEIDELNPDNYLVSFVFDALIDGSITIFYFAKEEPNCQFIPQYPEAHLPVRIPFAKGIGQKFTQPSGTGIDLGFFELEDLSKPSSGEDTFPLVIVAEAFSSIAHSTEDELDDSSSSTSNNKQITQAVLEKKDNGLFQVRVVKQILWIDGVRYELRELYGIGSSASEGFDDCDPGKECVICMTEPKDTAVLPCRHMCMCGECAKALRLQSNKCPICRQPIEELIEIKINGVDQ